MTNPAYEATNSDERDAFEIAFPLPKHAIRCGSGYACTDYNAWDAQKFIERWDGWKACALAKTPAPNGMMQLSNELAEMKPVKLPSRFFHVTVAETIAVLRESQVIEAITEAGGQVHSTCPRCKRTLDLTHKPNGEHYCHVVEGSE